jgi:hypothetical protein
MPKAPHQSIDSRAPSGLRGIVLQSFSKGSIQTLMLRSGYQSCLLDEAFVSA